MRVICTPGMPPTSTRRPCASSCPATRMSTTGDGVSPPRASVCPGTSAASSSRRRCSLPISKTTGSSNAPTGAGATVAASRPGRPRQGPAVLHSCRPRFLSLQTPGRDHPYPAPARTRSLPQAGRPAPCPAAGADTASQGPSSPAKGHPPGPASPPRLRTDACAPLPADRPMSP